MLPRSVKNVFHKQLEAESPDELLRQPVQHLSEPSGQVDSYHLDNNNTEHWLDDVQELSVWTWKNLWVLVPVSWSLNRTCSVQKLTGTGGGTFLVAKVLRTEHVQHEDVLVVQDGVHPGAGFCPSACSQSSAGTKTHLSTQFWRAAGLCEDPWFGEEVGMDPLDVGHHVHTVSLSAERSPCQG